MSKKKKCIATTEIDLNNMYLTIEKMLRHIEWNELPTSTNSEAAIQQDFRLYFDNYKPAQNI
jgi:hypothetical protein